MNEQEARDKFEAWMRKEHPTHPLYRNPPRFDGEVTYVNSGAQHKWLGYRAALAASTPPVAVEPVAYTLLYLQNRDAGRVMQSAYAFCPTDMPHPQRMAWMADFFLKNYTSPQADALDAARMAMADEYRAWIDFYHAGLGNYDDFLRAAMKEHQSHD